MEEKVHPELQNMFSGLPKVVIYAREFGSAEERDAGVYCRNGGIAAL